MKRKSKFYLKYGFLLFAGGIAGIKYMGRFLFGRFFKRATSIIMTDKYQDNLWEFVSAVTRTGLQKVTEVNMRSESGKYLERPLGSPKKFPSIESLMFPYAQLDTFPISEEEKIDTTVIIGKKSRKPLILETPIMIGGIGYGFAVSDKIRIALAKGATMAGTAVNTGQGGLLPQERKVAKQIILQYNRGHWSKDPETLRQADAIEFHFGQGAAGGSFRILPADKISRKMRHMFGVERGKRIVYPARFPEINHPRDLKKKVKELRSITDGIPIGVKLAGGDMLEKDLPWCLEAGLDYIALSGCEGASRGSPPTLLDDHGLPIIIALTRTVNFLEKEGAKKDIDLVVDGKLITPGDFLKVLALGADAVYIGTAALFAVAHTQVLKALPFEPPTEIAWNKGKFVRKFHINKGAKSLHLFLKSCVQEMKMSLSVMGKTSIQQLSKDDLVALDPYIAEITGVRLAHIPRG